MKLKREVFSHTRERNKNVHSPTPAKLLRIPFPTLPQFTNGPAEPPIVSDGAAVKAFFRATSVFCAATACWRAKKLCASLPSRSSAAECLFNINLIMTLKKSSIQSYKITKLRKNHSPALRSLQEYRKCTEALKCVECPSSEAWPRQSGEPRLLRLD